MILIMAVSVSYKMPAKAESISSRVGDVDTNGSINASDALLVLKYAAKLIKIDEELQKYADVNDDESINATDALDILKYAARLIDHFLADVPKTFTVSFYTDGGSKVADQVVNEGDLVSVPEPPEKDGFVFVGWYSSSDFTELFNFNVPVHNSCTIIARWVNAADTTDTDDDGLSDEWEKYFETDPNLPDTDGDGLSDYIEVTDLGYDPLRVDTDDNGIIDSQEDPDGDGIINSEEIKLGTDPALSDTDGDDLSDSDELNIYHTNPVLTDTDSDGANDGWEIKYQFDPLAYNASFQVEISSKGTLENNDVIASAAVIEDGKQAATLKVEAVEDYLLSSSIPGYLGSAYDFSINGEISSAVITFTYNPSLSENAASFQPRIYYFNEEDGTLEELENQTVSEGTVSATVKHFSRYILLDKIRFEEIWNTGIEPPDSDKVDWSADRNKDGIPDYYNDLIFSGDLVVSNGSKEFSGIDFNYDITGKLSDDYDGDGIKNGDEIRIAHCVMITGRFDKTDIVCIKINSNPTMMDTDGDGETDPDDSDPLNWNISDRDLAMASSMSYTSLSSVTYESKLANLSDSLKNEINNNFNEFGNVANLSELDRWSVIDSIDDVTDMQAVAFKVESNIVVAYAGTQGIIDWYNDVREVFNTSFQSKPAKQFIKRVMGNYPGCNVYIAGHSLGGNLAYHAAVKGLDYNASMIKRIVTFNGLGLSTAYYGFLTYESEVLNKHTSIIKDYSVVGDCVSQGILRSITKHYGGEPIMINKSFDVPVNNKLFGMNTYVDWNCHDLYNFLDYFAPRKEVSDQLYEDVVGKYVDAIFNFDYEEIIKYLAFDSDKWIYDYFYAAVTEAGCSIDEMIEAFASAFNGYLDEDTIKDLDSLVQTMYDVYNQTLQKEFKSYKADYEITDANKLNDYEIESAIEDNFPYDLRQLSDYFELNKVNKGYAVAVEVTFEIDGEVSEPFEMDFIVVEYKGDWKLVNNPLLSIGLLGRITGLN